MTLFKSFKGRRGGSPSTACCALRCLLLATRLFARALCMAPTVPPYPSQTTPGHTPSDGRAICATRARLGASCGDSFVDACRRWCDVAGDNADASKFNHRCAHAVTSRVHARRVACPAHSEPPCRTRVPRSQPACPPRWRRARGQVAELLANVNLSDLHARRHRVHPHAVARPQGVHEPGVRPLAARRASCACVRWGSPGGWPMTASWKASSTIMRQPAAGAVA